MRVFRNVGLAAAMVGAALAGAPPAAASNAGTIQFDILVTTPPLGTSVLSAPLAGGISVTQNNLCVGTSGPKNVEATGCTFGGAGVIGANPAGIGAHCDASGGFLAGTIQIGNTPVDYRVQFTTSGPNFTGTGTSAIDSQRGTMAIEASWTQHGTGSCLAATATTFRLIGTATFVAAEPGFDTGEVTFDIEVTTPPLGTILLSSPAAGGIAVTRTNQCTAVDVGNNMAAGTCTISGAGWIGGPPGAFCETAVGEMVGTISITGALSTVDVDYHVAFEVAPFKALGDATIDGNPGPITMGASWTREGFGSCPASTATTFRLIGTAHYDVT